jgi:hypothetical protein
LNGKEVIGTQDEHVGRYKIMMILVPCNISIASINYSAKIGKMREIYKRKKKGLYSADKLAQ